MATIGPWSKVGRILVRWVDENFLWGVGKATNEISEALSAVDRDSPLEWDHDFRKTYRRQKRVIWVGGEQGEPVVLPQTCLITPQEANDERRIQLEVIGDEFQPSRPVAGAVEFYDARAKSIGCPFFPDDCARLVGWNRRNRTLLFQRCSYFSYAATNLAMDCPQPVFGTLRKTHSDQGTLPDLMDNVLANLAGINCLVFSNDGYMIVQKREKVLIRLGEACSGASGTVTFMDIQHACGSGGRLANLDALREKTEELGLSRSYHRKRRFLGASRELIRGGAPEFFYSIDVDMKAEEICGLRRQDVEGERHAIPSGGLKSIIDSTSGIEELKRHFWALREEIIRRTKAPMSVPLLTNLVFWAWANCPKMVGQASMSQLLAASTSD